jgi:cytoskeletal protein CcmA (bactofilin family)
MESKNLQTLIAAGTVIEGKITGKTDVRIDGEIKGELSITGEASVSKNGKFNGQAEADVATIEGEYTGSVSARELIRITPDGKVKAELRAPAISIEKGAKFSGKIDMAE